MNIHNLTVIIPEAPSLDLTPLRKYTPYTDVDEEFYDTTTVPFNTPCIQNNKRVKYSSKNVFFPFDNLDDFLKFYSEDLSN